MNQKLNKLIEKYNRNIVNWLSFSTQPSHSLNATSRQRSWFDYGVSVKPIEHGVRMFEIDKWLLQHVSRSIDRSTSLNENDICVKCNIDKRLTRFCISDLNCGDFVKKFIGKLLRYTGYQRMREAFDWKYLIYYAKAFLVPVFVVSLRHQPKWKHLIFFEIFVLASDWQGYFRFWPALMFLGTLVSITLLLKSRNMRRSRLHCLLFERVRAGIRKSRRHKTIVADELVKRTSDTVKVPVESWKPSKAKTPPRKSSCFVRNNVSAGTGKNAVKPGKVWESTL